jgi:ribosomal protein S18 acetylase RimI-like enzyme
LEAIIRPARLEDAGALRRHCYPDHGLEDVQDYLAWCLRQAEKGRILRLVAEVAGQVVGNAQLTVWGREGEIGSLVVAEEYRRQGLASQLLTQLVAEARKRDLVALEIRVCACQPAILAFYERVGFQRVAQPVAPGQDGPDAVSTRDGEIKSGLSHPVRPGPVVRCRMLLQGR